MADTTVIYMQKRGLNFSGFTSAFMEFVGGKAGATVTDSAKFDEERPENLDVSIDSWTSLQLRVCLLYTSPSPRDKRQSRMPSSA